MQAGGSLGVPADEGPGHASPGTLSPSAVSSPARQVDVLCATPWNYAADTDIDRGGRFL